MIVGIIFSSFEVSMPSPRIRKMSLSRALDKYLKTVSVHKKGHQQE
ncbi:integrase, partial [Salmonella enterica subsp. enterica serovar Infantis]|nr:integrase [Salmonella enterica subsp. enterica serovar Infantis]